MSVESTALSKHYSSKDAEARWYPRWEAAGCFSAPVPRKSARSFTMVIPPPNVTGVLHMGHALNNTLQDVLARYHRMSGADTLWIPGTDHAGIATQAVVDRSLRSKGVEREKIGRDAFVRHVWEWKEKHGNTIIEQLRRMGCSCDWERTRFTLDAGLSQAVREVFIRLYDKGLIYRNRYIVNWSVGCQTALSDEEVIHKEITGALYHIRYDLADSSDSVVIATTRPETLLGDTAIGYNPKDERYPFLKGKKAILPLIGKLIPVIEDESIDPQFGTGVLKITPGHDPADFELGRKHRLDTVNILNPDGSLNANAGPYKNLDRFEARQRVVEDLKKEGRLVKTEEHRHSVGHCYRTDTLVEPYCSDQWFVRMKPLAEPALRAVQLGEIHFHPKRWTKVYEDWMLNIRDWCISRQIWWGHRIPVYYAADGRHTAAQDAVEARRKLGLSADAALTQDPDVLDTWFSSWLWPFSTLGWPQSDKTFDAYYPTQTLVTGYEIIFFWVARMIMAGFEFTGKAPFTDIYIHGIVRDQTGAKMSKSKGNVVDPIEIIDEFGADALRYSILSITGEGQDVFAAKDRFEIGRNFANKIWNAARFVLSAAPKTSLSAPPNRSALRSADRWILHRLAETTGAAGSAIREYRFNRITELLYDFIWGDFCDAYLELAKPYAAEPATAWTLRKVLDVSLRLIHPVMPFLSEEIWQLTGDRGPAEFLMTSAWPEGLEEWSDPEAAQEVDSILELIGAARKFRGLFRIQPGDLTDLSVRTLDGSLTDRLRRFTPEIQRLGRIREVHAGEKLDRPGQSALILVGPMTAYLHLGEVMDLPAELKRLQAEEDQTARALASLRARLANPDFLQKAPQEIVDKEKERQRELEAKISGLQEHRRSLG